LLQVNQKYIESASQEDAYRTEPPFKLQGSYRNMTKLAEKVVSAMNDEELEALIDDHYLGESQTLTTEAEQNLLMLKEIREKLTPDDVSRWETIKNEFKRRNMMGGGADDPVARVAGPLSSLVQRMEALHETMSGSSQLSAPLAGIQEAISAAVSQLQTEGVASRGGGVNAETMQQLIAALAESNRAPVEQPVGNVQQADFGQVEALIQKQTLMFEGTLNALAQLADAQVRSNSQSAEVMRAIEKVLQSGAAMRPLPPPVSVSSGPQTQQPARTGGGAAGGFKERPLTGMKQRVPFKDARKTAPAEPEPAEAAPTQKMQAIPPVQDAPAQQPSSNKPKKVKLEPPFDTDD
jgi:hypothetical protein